MAGFLRCCNSCSFSVRSSKMRLVGVNPAYLNNLKNYSRKSDGQSAGKLRLIILDRRGYFAFWVDTLTERKRFPLQSHEHLFLY